MQQIKKALYNKWHSNSYDKFWVQEPFLSTLQNMGVKLLKGVENFQQGELLFVQAAYIFECCKDAFYVASAGIFFWYLYKNFKKCQL